MKKICIVLLLALLAYLFFWPVSVEPVAWQPPSAPELAGAYAKNNKLRNVERFAERRKAPGPEDIAIDGLGRIYSGYPDGAIVRNDGPGTEQVTFANTGGRPLGMKFDRAGNLIVADGIKGLLSVASNGSITVLSTEAEGVSYRFADDLDIATNGNIYFTDASSRWGPSEVLQDISEHAGHGRLLKFDRSKGEATVLMTGLNFANGVALAGDESYLLVTETGAYRVWRYWLTGPHAGAAEVFIDNLPGFPDNINSGSDGRYWLALFGPRNAMLDAAAPFPLLRKIMLRLPAVVQPHPPVIGFVMALDGKGRVLETRQDFSGGAYGPITSVVEHDGWLYFGSLTHTHIARLRVYPGDSGLQRP